MATGEVKIPWSKEVTLEIERATDVEASTWHGWFKDEKYLDYEKQITNIFHDLCRENGAAPVAPQVSMGGHSYEENSSEPSMDGYNTTQYTNWKIGKIRRQIKIKLLKQVSSQ